MDVSALVRGVINSFEDASSLVRDIRDRKDVDTPIDPEAIQDLLDSLYLGPVVVRGYYDSDARRFGEQYVAGDPLAREQLKDVLIHLQMTVLTTLRTFLLDENTLNYEAIQAASDECRVNAGVCLGQLSQRLSDSSRRQSSLSRTLTQHTSHTSTPPLQYSTSRSTHSSSDSYESPPTPDLDDIRLTFFDPDLGSPWEEKRSSPFIPDKSHTSLGSYQDVLGSIEEADDTERRSMRRPSSTCLGHEHDAVISPVSSNFANSEGQSKNSPGGYGDTLHVPMRQSSQRSTNGRERFGPNDYADLQNANPFTPTGAPLTAIPSNNALDKRRPSEPRMPAPSPQSPRTITSRPSLSRRSPRAPTELPPPPPIPVPRRPNSPSSHAPIPIAELSIAPPIPAKSRARSLSSGARTPSRPYAPLTLPTEKNLLGFCKGAFRLQSGLEKKAFSITTRPVGYASTYQFWQCEKCQFEGPISSVVPPGAKKNKPEKRFDSSIREWDGIRFKWVFLAKCHVQLKSQATGPPRRDGSFGSFGCIFCTAESSNREWPSMNVNAQGEIEKVNTRSSISTTSSGTVVGCNTPIFGNLSSFMEHLQMHRQEPFWPGTEMQGRMKCVAGRIAERGEDFDINFLPMTVK